MFVRAMKSWYDNYDAQGKPLKPQAAPAKLTTTTTPASQTTTTPASQTTTTTPAQKTTTEAVQAKPATTTPATTIAAATKVVITSLPDDVERIIERIGQFLV